MDFAVLNPWELNLMLSMTRTLTWFPELYLLNSKLCLSFLARLDKNSCSPSYVDVSEIDSKIKELEKEWISYDVKMGVEK